MLKRTVTEDGIRFQSSVRPDAFDVMVLKLHREQDRHGSNGIWRKASNFRKELGNP